MGRLSGGYSCFAALPHLELSEEDRRTLRADALALEGDVLSCKIEDWQNDPQVKALKFFIIGRKRWMLVWGLIVWRSISGIRVLEKAAEYYKYSDCRLP